MSTIEEIEDEIKHNKIEIENLENDSGIIIYNNLLIQNTKYLS